MTQSETQTVVRELEATIGRRLDEMERENRALRKTTMLLGFGLVVFMFASAVLLVIGPGFLTSSDTVNAEQFVLRDSDGFVRGSWGIGENGTTQLAHRDRDGRERMKLTLLRDGSPGLTLADRDGRSRVVLGLLPDETSTLVFADRHGRSRTVLGVSPDESSTLVFANEAGETRLGLGLGADGDAGLTVYENGVAAGPADAPPADTADLEEAPELEGAR